jgi:hypothetical protein
MSPPFLSTWRERLAGLLILLVLVGWLGPRPVNGIYWLTTKYGGLVPSGFADIGGSSSGQILRNKNNVVQGIPGWQVTGASEDTLTSIGGQFDCADCIDANDITEAAVTREKIADAATDPATSNLNLATYGRLMNVLTQTLSTSNAQIDCGTYGPSMVVLTVASNLTLTSSPQILTGGTRHVCYLWNKSTTNVLEIVNGSGVANYASQSVFLSPGMVLEYGYDLGGSGLWEHHLRSPFEICQQTFSGGELLLNCGSGGFAAPLRNVPHATNPITLAAADMQGQWHVNTSGAGQTYTLPPLATGLWGCFETNSASVLTIDPSGSEIIRHDGSDGSAGQALASAGTAADFLCVKADSTATHWLTRGRAGTWAF